MTQFAAGVLGQHERDATSDWLVAERVYEMAAAQAVGDFLRAASVEPEHSDPHGPRHQ